VKKYFYIEDAGKNIKSHDGIIKMPENNE